jgi:serine/threonine-protein kinase
MPGRSSRPAAGALLRKIGGGGMGVVYEARDERLNRRVALKIIRGDQHFFAGSRARFAREMQAASRLDHPHLCPIYDAGEIDGVPYIAMRYVEGRSLAALLTERRRERADASSRSRPSSGHTRLDDVLLIEKIARALHAAHEAGIVHRDVKPANVLIGSDGEPVLVDFGLAHDTDSEEPGLTHTGERVGTPAYMAPEQVSGRGAIDRRTDVYGLGATLYECMTLHSPFVSSAREDLYSWSLHAPPPDPRVHARSIQSELSVVVG